VKEEKNGGGKVSRLGMPKRGGGKNQKRELTDRRVAGKNQTRKHAAGNKKEESNRRWEEGEKRGRPFKAKVTANMAA